MTYLLLKFLHVLGAVLLLGTGIGIAFFMLMAHRTRDAFHIARTAATVVVADFVFTATAALVQPITGFLLMRQTGGSLAQGWIVLSLVLYLVAGASWIPVIWLQMRMRDLARFAAKNDEPLPTEYHDMFRRWAILGVPGFGSVVVIVWLMLAKPLL